MILEFTTMAEDSVTGLLHRLIQRLRKADAEDYRPVNGLFKAMPVPHRSCPATQGAELTFGRTLAKSATTRRAMDSARLNQ
jgi:hypothetical protein